MAFPPAAQLLQDSLVVILLLILIPTMVAIIVISPVIQTDTPYIVPGVTAAATVFTALVKDRIRHGLIRSLEAPLRRIQVEIQEEEQDEETGNDEGDVKSQRSSVLLETLDTKWRGVLGINDLSEMTRVAPILLVYLPTALLMTAIVTTFTPTMSQRNVDHRPMTAGARYPLTLTGDTVDCAGIAPNMSVVPRHSFGWGLSNGSAFFGSYYGKDCPSTAALPHLPNINTVNPDLYAYVDSGVAIHRTALGASANLFRGPAVQHLDTTYTGRLRKTTQCAPVMVSNPITCDKGGGTLRRGKGPGDLIMKMDFAAKDYYVREVSLARNLSKDSGMANYLWGDPRQPDQPGKGFFVFGAWDAKVSDAVGFGRELARAIRDPNAENVTDPRSRYVVTCKIDARRSFEYRQVTLAVQGGETGGSKDGDDAGVLTNHINYNRILYGGDKCTPVDESISYLHAVAAFTVHYKLALENFGLDGFFETVHRMAGGNRGPPYAFNNSRNGLEDALGVVSAIGASTMVVHEESGAIADAVDRKATAVIVVRQLGYGNLIVLLLVLPPLAALFITMYFFYVSFRTQNQPGGGVVASQAHVSSGPYAAESLCRLVGLRHTDVSENTALKLSMASQGVSSS